MFIEDLQLSYGNKPIQNQTGISIYSMILTPCDTVQNKDCFLTLRTKNMY